MNWKLSEFIKIITENYQGTYSSKYDLVLALVLKKINKNIFISKDILILLFTQITCHFAI